MSDVTTDGRRTLNLVQAAALCGVCRRTLYNWLEAGKIEGVRTVDGAPRIVAESLFHIRRSQRQAPGTRPLDRR